MSVVEEVCSHVAILDEGEVVEKGKVSDIFSNPQSDAAKRLVFPDGAKELPPAVEGEKRIRIVFNGAAAAHSPLITRMAIDINIAANILSASTSIIDNKVFGNMLLGINGGDEALMKAKDYLQRVGDVIVEEI